MVPHLGNPVPPVPHTSPRGTGLIRYLMRQHVQAGTGIIQYLIGLFTVGGAGLLQWQYPMLQDLDGPHRIYYLDEILDHTDGWKIPHMHRPSHAYVRSLRTQETHAYAQNPGLVWWW